MKQTRLFTQYMRIRNNLHRDASMIGDEYLSTAPTKGLAGDHQRLVFTRWLQQMGSCVMKCSVALDHRAVFLVSMVLALVACSKKEEPPAATIAAPSTALEGQVDIVAWPGYIE